MMAHLFQPASLSLAVSWTILPGGSRYYWLLGSIAVNLANGTGEAIQSNGDFTMGAPIQAAIFPFVPGKYSEPAIFGFLVGCQDEQLTFPRCPLGLTSVDFPATTFQATVEEVPGGFEVTSEEYIFSAPEPSSFLLLGPSLIGLAGVFRRKTLG